jgi:hypothetical protein
VDVGEAIVTVFHGSVLLLGAIVLGVLLKVMRYQRRILETKLIENNRRDPVFRRVLDAAVDWYDDKPDSKRLLRDAVAALKLDPHHLALPAQREERYLWVEGPYGKEEMKVEAHPLVWAEVDDLRKLRAETCSICKAPPGAKCDAGLHG